MILVKFVKKHYYPLIIFGISILVCLLSFTSNTFLTGWDTLHPELNLALNLKRLVFGVWRSEQGLGAVAGHSHMADLPRVLILSLLNIFLPTNLLRYSYVFICFIVGPLGIYYLIRYNFPKNKHSGLLAFLSSLFYIFNLGTIQQFVVPFEMFITQWAFLPWIILFSLKSLNTPSRKNIFFFVLFTFFSTPQSYAAHLWYPFFLAFSALLIIYSLISKIKLKKPINLIVLTLLINSFWILPNLYFIKTSSAIPQNFKGNQLHSQEFLLRNRQTGNLSDSSQNKGFYLNWQVYDFDNTRSVDLLPTWNNHLQNQDVKLIGYSLFLLSLTGLIYGIKANHPLAISTLTFFIPSFILLTNNIPPFKWLFELLLKISFLKEILRFIYTKVSIIYQFSLVIYFSFFLKLILKKVKNTKLISIIIVTSLLIYSFPIFQSGLISDKVKIHVPQKYFNTWDFFKTQPQGKILTLPLHNSTGWQYYDWGYQGSGFLWFNLNQSLFDRDFDRWSLQNEQSYYEFFNTLYSKNPDNFLATLNKFNTSYIIWDQSLISTQAKNVSQIIFKYEIKDILDKLVIDNHINQIATFDNIYIYKINQAQPLISLTNISADISPPYQKSIWDTAFFENGTYKTSSNPNINYPLRNILLQNETIDPQTLDITYSNNLWTVNLLPQTTSVVQKQEDLVAVDTFYDSTTSTLTLKPYLPKYYKPVEIKLDQNLETLDINQDTYNINLNINNQYLGISFINTKSQNYINNQAHNLVFFKQIDNNDSSLQNLGINLPAKLIKQSNLDNNNITITSDNMVNFYSLNSTQGINLKFPNLNHQSAYIIAIKSKYIEGLPLKICLKNNYSFICNIDNQLHNSKKLRWQYFLAPPLDTELGYELHINAVSYANFPSQSLIEQISIIPLPLNYLSSTKQIYSKDISKTEFIKTNTSINLPFLYKTSTENKDNADTLIFHQTFNKSWLAFYLNGLKPVLLKDHILINNWANGWQLCPVQTEHCSVPSTIYIFFWPQILEFLGFFLLLLTFIYVLKSKSKPLKY